MCQKPQSQTSIHMIVSRKQLNQWKLKGQLINPLTQNTYLKYANKSF